MDYRGVEKTIGGWKRKTKKLIRFQTQHYDPNCCKIPENNVFKFITVSDNKWKTQSCGPGLNGVCFSLLPSCRDPTHWPPSVCLRDRGPVVPCRSVLRTVLCDLPASGKHPTASEACHPGSAVRLDLLLHLDLPSSARLEQIHYKQDRDHLRAWLVRNESFIFFVNPQRVMSF